MMRNRAVWFVLAALIVVMMALFVSFTLLPPAPTAPTPTWPQGVDLPDKLPRIPR
jgi:predicted MFS family arabinose efflux permease